MPRTHPENPPTSASRLAAIQRRIADVRGRMIAPRPAPLLVAVSKTHPADAVEAVAALGLTHFAENKIQEAASKWPALKARHPGLTLHLIGPLQSNKAAEAVALFDVIETIDREKIVDAIAAEAKKQGRSHEVLIQVNTGDEPQKSGVSPAGLEALVDYTRNAGLNLTGLMCIPPSDALPAPHFAMLRRLAERHGLPVLSMGMSGDYEEAVRMGATHLRLGTALFGERQT